MRDPKTVMDDIFAEVSRQAKTRDELLRSRGWKSAAACFGACVIHEKTAGFPLPISRAYALEAGAA